MRAAVAFEKGNRFVVVDDVEMDAPRGREVVVDVRASGLCHSDLHAIEMAHTVTFPSVRGHEIAGVIAAVGPDVSDVTIGDHVVGCLIPWCGQCDQCRAGHKTLCRNPTATLRAAGEPSRLTRGGTDVSQGQGMAGFGAQVLTHENQLTVIDRRMPFAQAAVLGCSTITGAGAVQNVAGVRTGQSVAVFGCGGVGLNVINAAAVAGAAPIIAIDTNPGKLGAAQDFGATDTVDASAEDAVERIRAIAPGGVDHAFEVVGIAQTQLQAWTVLGVGGGAYLMGMSALGTVLPIDTAESHRMQKSVRQVYLGGGDPRCDIPRYVELYLSGDLNLDGIVSRTIGVEQINDAYAALVAGETVRSVITEF